MKLNYKIDLFKKSESDWETTPTDITNYCILESIRVTNAVGKSKDKFEFDLDNANNKFVQNVGINAEDKVRIYFWEGTASVNTSSDLLMEGIITTPRFTARGRRNGSYFLFLSSRKARMRR